MRACALRGKRALGAVLKLDSSNFGECETGWLARFERERAATCSRFVLSASQPVVHSVRHSRSASQPKRVVRQTRSRALRCAARLVPLPQRRLRSSNTNDIVLPSPLTSRLHTTPLAFSSRTLILFNTPVFRPEAGACGVRLLPQLPLIHDPHASTRV